MYIILTKTNYFCEYCSFPFSQQMILLQNLSILNSYIFFILLFLNSLFKTLFKIAHTCVKVFIVVKFYMHKTSSCNNSVTNILHCMKKISKSFLQKWTWFRATWDPLCVPVLTLLYCHCIGHFPLVFVHIPLCILLWQSDSELLWHDSCGWYHIDQNKQQNKNANRMQISMNFVSIKILFLLCKNVITWTTNTKKSDIGLPNQAN